MDFILNGLTTFMDFLDWIYILTVIALLWLTDPRKRIYKGKSGFIKWLGKNYSNIQPSIRVFILGSIYGTVLFYIRDMDRETGLEKLIVSLLFTMVFHKIIIKNLVKYFIDGGKSKP